MALGSDSGRSGGLGLIVLPGALALLATASVRRRWVAIMLCLGALVAVATGLGRIQVVGAVLAVLAFVGLVTIAGRRISRPVGALLAVIAVAVPLGIVFVQATGSGVFSRYQTLATIDPTTNCKDCKRGALKRIPHQISVAPFGIGLGNVGAAGAFGGKATDLEEVQKISSETQYTFLTDELGAPGLILWTAFILMLIGLPVFRLRRIRDPEMRIWLAAASAPLIAIAIVGTSGPVSAGGSLGPYLWFAAGICAYWFAGPGLSRRPAARSAGPGRNRRGMAAVPGA